jgi:hypothetical protein
MKNTKANFYLTALAVTVLATAIVCFSCATTAGKTKTPVILPLTAGWYQYDTERTYKGIEFEYNLAQSGIKALQEITWKYTGVVCRFEDGVLFDPVTNIELSIDNKGQISCVENVSIRGTMEKDGRFSWSGVKEENGSLNSVFVKGTLTPLPPSVRGGREFDGIYRMADTGTGREILAKVESGFYTWRYNDGEEAGFTPWPTLIRPDGTFFFSLDLTTVMAMGDQKMDFSNSVFTEGKVIPGQGVSMEQSVRSSGLGQNQSGPPQIYAGTAIRSGEVPNEAVPADIESIVRSGREAVKAEPKPNRAQYPSWYLRPPSKTGFIYASGEKTFAVQETAFAMAEAVAVANLADLRWMRIESTVTDITDASGNRTDERINTESLQQLNYRIIERHYNTETNTAFVLAEMAVQ